MCGGVDGTGGLFDLASPKGIRSIDDDDGSDLGVINNADHDHHCCPHDDVQRAERPGVHDDGDLIGHTAQFA